MTKLQAPHLSWSRPPGLPQLRDRQSEPLEQRMPFGRRVQYPGGRQTCEAHSAPDEQTSPSCLGVVGSSIDAEGGGIANPASSGARESDALDDLGAVNDATSRPASSGTGEGDAL